VLNDVKDVGLMRFSSKDVFRHTLVQKIIEAYERYKGK
jgi:phosphate starvation-inducible protein PhoH